jgi:hypothetical protein
VARIHWWIMWSIATREFQIENNRCWAFHWFRTRWFGGRGWIGFRIVGFHRKNCPDLGSGECFTRISDLINTAARLRIYLIFWLVSRILLQIWADRWICIPQFPPPPVWTGLRRLHMFPVCKCIISESKFASSESIDTCSCFLIKVVSMTTIDVWTNSTKAMAAMLVFLTKESN